MAACSGKSLSARHASGEMVPISEHWIWRMIWPPSSAAPVLGCMYGPCVFSYQEISTITPNMRNQKDVFPDRGKPNKLKRTGQIRTVIFSSTALSQACWIPADRKMDKQAVKQTDRQAGKKASSQVQGRMNTYTNKMSIESYADR